MRWATTSSRTGKHYKRSYRSFHRRSRKVFRRRASTQGKARFKKIVKSVVPLREFFAEYGQERSAPDPGTFPLCVYFTCERYDNTKTVDNVQSVVLFDYKHLGTILDYYWYQNPGSTTNMQGVLNGTGATESIKSKLWMKGVQLSTIRCQSNETEFFTAYYVRPRRPINFAGNLLSMMAQGFGLNGIDGNNYTPSTNLGMYTEKYTPFDSLLFSTHFKVFKVKKFKLAPSEQKTLRIAKSMKFNPLAWYTLNSTSTAVTWRASAATYTFTPFQPFILFKLHSRIAGYGGVVGDQTTYTRLINNTSPTCIMKSYFKYKTRLLRNTSTAAENIETVGFNIHGVVPAAIVVPDGDVLGAELDAY